MLKKYLEKQYYLWKKKLNKAKTQIRNQHLINLLTYLQF